MIVFKRNYNFRVCFSLTAFFFLMSLVTIRVLTSKDPRAKFHNGYVLKLFFLNLLNIHHCIVSKCIIRVINFCLIINSFIFLQIS